ncbi:hypothetical protein AVEN_190207-1 [Araneus ventricosus]|uniref:Uncharacterized protein n=1 Tax=Araneus ventricosus TaxID=182803 RepID=A0A4Y2R6Y3_ARAVE|nr:hypothetical protein AVEN_190207-1 [Araneus ventricosus]
MSTPWIQAGSRFSVGKVQGGVALGPISNDGRTPVNGGVARGLQIKAGETTVPDDVFVFEMKANNSDTHQGTSDCFLVCEFTPKILIAGHFGPNPK